MSTIVPLRLRGAGKILIGVVHLQPLPGAPRWKGNIEKVVERAIADARAYEQGGADAVIVENFGDVPFTRGSVPPETVAALAVAGRAVRQACKLPLGFNVLRNDAHSALALCAACEGSFIRVNVHTGAMLTDQGIIEGQAFETLRLRERLCPEVQIFADVHVKHAVPLGPIAIEISARDTLERGLADGLIISGTGTGVAAELRDLERVRSACPKACILLGSGVSEANAGEFMQLSNGAIVGSSLKRGGVLGNAVDPKRVRKLQRAMQHP